MKKHVYQFNEYINRHELLQDIYPLIHEENGISDTYDKIIKYLNIDSNSLTNKKVNIEILNQKKNIENYLLSFNLDKLDSKDDRESIIKKLELLGIKEKNVDLNEFKNFVNIILYNKVILNQLNNLNMYTYENVQKILFDNNIIVSESILRNFVDLLNRLSLSNLTDTISNFNPIKRTQYYDENNNIVSKIVMEIDKNLFSTLTEFSGEIYESLNFINNEEAKKFQEDNDIYEDLLEDVVSFIHFHAESTVNDWYNDLSIVKYKMGCIYINYGERLFVQNIKNNSSIIPEEVDAIINEFKYRDINNEFIKYVVNELEQFKKSLNGKDIRKKIEDLSIYDQEKEELTEMINKRNNSLKEVYKILTDKNYGNNKTIFVKIKVISDTPITFEKSNTMILK
mgnify:FL=1